MMHERNNHRLLKKIGTVLDSQRVGVMATQYDGAPHESLIAYVSSQDLREIVFAAPLHTRKVAAIEKDPQVAFLVDNRQNIEGDFTDCMAVTAKGSAERLSDDRRPSFVSQYLERHPYLKEFALSPSCGFFVIRVRQYSFVSRFQQVEEIILS